MEEIDKILYEIKLHQRALETKRQVVMAELSKENEMLAKFESWAENLQEAIKRKE